MSTHVQGLQSFNRFLHNFVLAKLVTNGIRVNSQLSGQACKRFRDSMFIIACRLMT